MPIWLHPLKLILASRSQARRALLQQSGIPFETIPADVDERQLQAGFQSNGGNVLEVAQQLAFAKAKVVGLRMSSHVVLGSDQCLELEGQALHKSDTLQEAALQLKALSGRWHSLHAAASVFSNGAHICTVVETARLKMRDLSDRYIEDYLRLAGRDILGSVGAYHIEGVGLQLFEHIEGHQSTIMGLPMLPILKSFRENGFLQS